MPATLYSLYFYIRNVEISSGGRGVMAWLSISREKRTQYRKYVRLNLVLENCNIKYAEISDQNFKQLLSIQLNFTLGIFKLEC